MVGLRSDWLMSSVPALPGVPVGSSADSSAGDSAQTSDLFFPLSSSFDWAVPLGGPPTGPEDAAKLHLVLEYAERGSLRHGLCCGDLKAQGGSKRPPKGGLA